MLSCLQTSLSNPQGEKKYHTSASSGNTYITVKLQCARCHTPTVACGLFADRTEIESEQGGRKTFQGLSRLCRLCRLQPVLSGPEGTRAEHWTSWPPTRSPRSLWSCCSCCCSLPTGECKSGSPLFQVGSFKHIRLWVWSMWSLITLQCGICYNCLYIHKQ